MWIILMCVIGYFFLFFLCFMITNKEEIKKKIFRKNNNAQQVFEYYLETFPITAYFPSPPSREYNFFG